jgi:hypothetical protein
MASPAPSKGLESPEALARLNATIMGERNPRGIPSAVFVVRLTVSLHPFRHAYAYLRHWGSVFLTLISLFSTLV